MEKREVGSTKQELIEEARRLATEYELAYHGCGQCTMLALQQVLGLEDELVFKAASCVHSGIALEGKTCGALAAGVMVIGMKFGREHIEEGSAGVLKGVIQTHRLLKWFEQEFGSTECSYISGLTGQVNEELLKDIMAHPEVMEQAPELVEKCAQLAGKTAAKVVEIVGTDE